MAQSVFSYNFMKSMRFKKKLYITSHDSGYRFATGLGSVNLQKEMRILFKLVLLFLMFEFNPLKMKKKHLLKKTNKKRKKVFKSTVPFVCYEILETAHCLVGGWILSQHSISQGTK